MSSNHFVSEIFEADRWQSVPGFAFEGITYHRARAIAAVRIAFNWPEVRNAFGLMAVRKRGKAEMPSSMSVPPDFAVFPRHF